MSAATIAHLKITLDDVKRPVLRPPWNRQRVLPGAGHLRQKP
jgi:hypothetical protein